MLSVRAHPKLEVLFKISKCVGVWIPREGERIPKWPTAWEIFMLIFAIVSCCMMLATLLSTIPEVRLELVGQPLIISVLYFTTILKAAQFTFNKKRIVKLFSKIDAFVRNPVLGNSQAIVVNHVCDKSRKSLFLQLLITELINLVVTVLFSMMLIHTYEHVASKDKDLTNEDKINDQVFNLEKWQTWNFVASGLNCAWCLILPISNISMDCIMYLCHYFIAQETDQLRRMFVKGSLLHKGFTPVQRDNFDMWVTLFNSLNR